MSISFHLRCLCELKFVKYMYTLLSLLHNFSNILKYSQVYLQVYLFVCKLLLDYFRVTYISNGPIKMCDLKFLKDFDNEMGFNSELWIYCH